MRRLQAVVQKYRAEMDEDSLFLAGGHKLNEMGKWVEPHYQWANKTCWKVEGWSTFFNIIYG